MTFEELYDRYLKMVSSDVIFQKFLSGWLESSRLGSIKVPALSKPATMKKFRDNTRTYTRKYFDERPAVVSTLKDYFLYCAIPPETIASVLAFDKIYHPDEVYILLLKYLQGNPENGQRRTRSDIADYFSTSINTIDTYVNELQDGISLFGNDISVEVMRGTNECESSVHPIFLPLNLVNVYTL